MNTSPLITFQFILNKIVIVHIRHVIVYMTCSNYSFSNVFADCKKGHYAVLSNSTQLLECPKCAVDTYQEVDSRLTECKDCPEGANTNETIGSIECCMF